MKKTILVFVLFFLFYQFLMSENFSLSFDGVNDWVGTLYPGPLNNSARTVSYWAKFIDSTHVGTFSYGGYGPGTAYILNHNWWAAYDPGPCYGPAFSIESAGISYDEASVLDYDWHHYAYVLEEGSTDYDDIIIYVDGNLMTSVCSAVNYGTSLNTGSAKPIEIGRFDFNDTRYMKGHMDEVSIWDCALTQQEIQALIFTFLTGNEPGLIGYWNFNEGTGTTAYDATVNGNDGTIYGATWSDDNPGCVAYFVADNTVGLYPLTVNFTDLSSAYMGGTIIEWDWDFDDEGTSTLQDPTHEYSDHGFYTVSLTVTDENDFTDTEIKIDYITVLSGYDTYSLYFDSSSDYVSFPYSSIWDFDEDNFTIECWFYIPNTTNYKGIFSSETDYTLGMFLVNDKTGYFPSSNGTSRAQLLGDTGGANAQGSIVITPNEWHHVAFVRDGDNWICYIDGEEDLNISVSGTVFSKNETKLIGKFASYWHYGYIDEFRIWDRAFSQTELLRNICNYHNGTESNLTALWKFDEGSGDIVYDSTPNNNNGLLNDVVWSLDVHSEHSSCPLTADFAANVTTGIWPLTVNFTDLSSAYMGTIIEWDWDFGDGGTSTLQYPTNEYSSSGLYTVSLTVTDETDSTDTEIKTDYISVYSLNAFNLLAPTSFSVDVDVFPRFEWQSANPLDRTDPIIYEVYISTMPLFNPESTLMYSTNETFLYPPRDLIVGTTYFWKVRAFIDNGPEIWSNGNYWLLTTVFQTPQLFPMIDGLIADHRTLIPENSPYWLATYPHTASGKNLTIEEGVNLKFFENICLQINGNLFVYGTETEPVIFEPVIDTLLWAGIGYGNPGFPRDSLIVDENNNYISGNSIIWSELSKANFPLNCNSDIYISNSLFSNNNTGSLQQSGSYLISNLFEYSGVDSVNSFAINGGKFISNNTITTIDGFAIQCDPEAILLNNTISDVTGYAIDGGILIEDNEIINCGDFGITANINAQISRNIIDVISSFGVFGGNHLEENTITNCEGFGIQCNLLATVINNIISDINGFGINGGILIEDNEILNIGESGITSDLNAQISRNTLDTIGSYGINGGIHLEENLINDCNGYGIQCDSTATLINNTVTYNDGFAIKGGSLIDNNIIIGNNGGAIESSCYATITNNIIHDNSGHIIIKGLIIEDNDIVNNSKFGDYCAIESNYTTSFGNNNIIDNTNNYHSGNDFRFLNFELCDTLIFYNNTIKNTFNRHGQVLFLSGNSINIESNVIDSIDSDYPILWINQTDNNCSIINNQITNSTSYTIDGCAIYIVGSGSLQITNNTISHNLISSPGGRGAGIFHNNGQVDIISNTITFNTADLGSAIWLNVADLVSLEENIITQNTGAYAIWGNPLTLTQNNIFYNYYYSTRDTTLLNLRYTGSTQESFIYNFWGTRSDQGSVDPSIYDDNEDPSIGMVIYQPILSAPSTLTPGQLSFVDSVMVTINNNDLTVNNFGASDGETVYLCLIAEDANEFSLDLTEVSVINQTTFFPLQPLMWETGQNTGIFRNEITISSTTYNPQLNIMMANVGDTLKISSTVDTSKVFYLPIIDISLPQNINIQFATDTITISWDPVYGATSYKIYSSDNPYSGFTEDFSGTYIDTSWTCPASDVKKFYKVTAIKE